MKRIVYLLALIGVVFTGCDPIEDINNDIDSQSNSIQGFDEFTMTSDDYADLVDQGDDEEPDFYETFEAFADIDDAKVILPPFLTDKYPFWGDGSSVTVNFNLIDGNPEDVSAFTNADVYNLASSDYPSANSNAFLMGENVDSTLDNVLANQFATPTEGQVVRLGYNQFIEEPVVGLASVYEVAFPADFGNFELIEVFDDGVPADMDDIGWSEQASNVTGSGFDGDQVTTEEWLISPEIDLTGETGLTLQLTQEIDFLGDADLIDVLVSTDYTTGGDPMTATWNAVTFDKTIFGSLTTSEDLDFSAYDGETIHIALFYSSVGEDVDPADNTGDAARWRVQDFAIRTIGFSGETESLSAYYKYSEGFWDDVDGVYYLSTADYDSMGTGSGQPGQFNNFSGSVLPENYLPQFLNINYPFAQEGDELFLIYRFFVGGSTGTVTKGNLYTLNSGTWSPTISSLQFGLEDGVWVPDNTIRYTLSGGDYGLIASELLTVEGYEAAAGNLDNFGNFNRTGDDVGDEPSGTSNWNDLMVIRALNIVLDNIDPSAEEGQKYVVTIAVWAPGNSTEEFAMIKNEGEWVTQSSLE